METRHYWEENGHAVKYENYNGGGCAEELGRGGSAGALEPLGFAAHSDDEGDYAPGAGYLKKGKQDPMSHRIIEKRRRDRMNNCLADLSRLIPPEYLKKGRGRVEKTEIIEMAIRHLKFLQERVTAAEKQVGEEQFKAGFQEAVAEAVRYLADVHGHGPGDGVCVELANHLHTHHQHLNKGEGKRDKCRTQGSSSETASSSSSSHSYGVKASAGAQGRRPEPSTEPLIYAAPEPYGSEQSDQLYSMDCDAAIGEMPLGPGAGGEGEADLPLPESLPLPLDARRRRTPTLRAVRKPDHEEDYLHSYKFKNSIERRFSRSQDYEATDMTVRLTHAHGGAARYSHKRRRVTKPAPAPSCTSTSASGSTEDQRDTSPQDTCSESPYPHHEHYEKVPSAPPPQFVPVFALNTIGKYYVPLSVEYSCLSRHGGGGGHADLLDALDSRAAHLPAPLHPVTIHVNFQPCLNYHHLKREPHTTHEPPAHWRQHLSTNTCYKH